MKAVTDNASVCVYVSACARALERKIITRFSHDLCVKMSGKSDYQFKPKSRYNIIHDKERVSYPEYSFQVSVCIFNLFGTRAKCVQAKHAISCLCLSRQQ
jgi:hypothetical protein